MKAILVATDFSDAAANAQDYAAEMAYVIGAKLILFHACHVPVLGTEIPVEIQTMEEIEQRGWERLSEIAGLLQNRYRNQVEIECVCKCGFAVDEINRFARTGKVGMVVMGMRGTGNVAAKLFGSVTTSVLSESDCPVLVVNDTIKFRMIKKIVFACNIENQHLNLPEPLRELALFFKSHIYVLDVVPASVLVPSGPGEITNLGTFIRQFSNISHSFHFWNGENPVEGINDFVTEKNMDMVVMMPHQRSFISRFFNPSNTKRMAFHSKVPLLVLHEPENNTK